MHLKNGLVSSLDCFYWAIPVPSQLLRATERQGQGEGEGEAGKRERWGKVVFLGPG